MKATSIQFLLLFTALITVPALGEARPTAREIAVETLIEELGLRESDRPVRTMRGWRKPRKVLVLVDNLKRLEAMRSVVPGVRVEPVQDLQSAIRLSSGANAILGFCDEELLRKAGSVHWIQVYWAGVEDCVSLPPMQNGNMVLTNGQRIASPAIAEHAVAMMMSLMRGLDIFQQKQQQGTWDRSAGSADTTFFELTGRTVLVVGLGGIGSQVARRAHGLGMRVIATRGSKLDKPEYVDYVGLAPELIELASQADVVINTAPLTDSTRDLFDSAFFKAMKSSAYFISVGRGASTVTDDLVAALQQGDIAGAGLDVMDPEPLPADHPLWSTPRTIITPHVAGRSDKSRERLWLLVQENLRRYVEGEPLLSVVDIKRGY